MSRRAPPRRDQVITIGVKTWKPLATNWSCTICSQLLYVQTACQRGCADVSLSLAGEMLTLRSCAGKKRCLSAGDHLEMSGIPRLTGREILRRVGFAPFGSFIPSEVDENGTASRRSSPAESVSATI